MKQMLASKCRHIKDWLGHLFKLVTTLKCITAQSHNPLLAVIGDLQLLLKLLESACKLKKVWPMFSLLLFLIISPLSFLCYLVILNKEICKLRDALKQIIFPNLHIPMTFSSTQLLIKLKGWGFNNIRIL